MLDRERFADDLERPGELGPESGMAPPVGLRPRRWPFFGPDARRIGVVLLQLYARYLSLIRCAGWSGYRTQPLAVCQIGGPVMSVSPERTSRLCPVSR